MHKTFFTNCLLSLFVGLSILLINPKITSADCEVELWDKDKTQKLTELPSDFNGTVSVVPKNSPECFSENQQFVVAVYPNLSLNELLKYQTNPILVTTAPYFITRDKNDIGLSTPIVHKGEGIDCTPNQYCLSLKGPLNLATPVENNFGSTISYLQGAKYSNTEWNIVVCSGDNTINNNQCVDPIAKKITNKKIATGRFMVSDAPSTPPSPPPRGLPEIDISPPAECVLRSGDNIKFNLKNIDPNTYYEWWWVGKTTFFGQKIPHSLGKGPTTLTIEGSETAGLINITRTLCVDWGIDGPKREDPKYPQNCVNLEFQNHKIDEKTNRLCNPKTRGSSNDCTTLKTICEKKGLVCDEGRCVNRSSGKGLSCGTKGVATAIGCVETTPTDLIKNIFTFFVGVSGGIAFLTMLYGGFKMMVSRGEPQALSGAKQLFTSAIIGLLFVVFAILLLQIIGADILSLPGFKS